MRWAYLDHPVPFGIAHRGGNTGPPENTVAAFAAAVEMGYLYLETDVHLSSDGVLVAFHDDDLSRLVGHDAAIGDLRWDEIREIDLGDGHHIPRLEELLDAFPTSRFNIDPKSDQAVEPLASMISEYGLVDNICIGSFEQDRIDRAQALLGPSLCTSPATPGALRVVAAALFWPRWKSRYGCLQIPPRWKRLPLTSSWFIRRVQRMGMQVHYWTINEVPEMHHLLDRGADAIITDNVVELAAVLEQRRSSPNQSPH